MICISNFSVYLALPREKIATWILFRDSRSITILRTYITAMDLVLLQCMHGLHEYYRDDNLFGKFIKKWQLYKVTNMPLEILPQ